MKQVMLLAAPIAAALAACGATGSDDQEYRAAFVGQCEEQIRGRPQLPAGLDLRGACSCAVDAAFANRTELIAYAKSADGQQAFGNALQSCLQQRAAGMAPPAANPAPVPPPIAAPAPAEASDLPSEDAEVEAEPEE